MNKNHYKNVRRKNLLLEARYNTHARKVVKEIKRKLNNKILRECKIFLKLGILVNSILKKSYHYSRLDTYKIKQSQF